MRNHILVLLGLFLFQSCLIINFWDKKTPKENFDVGEQKLNEGDDINAIVYFTKAIKQDPQYLEAYGERAKVFLKSDSFNLAIQDYSKIIELKPSGEAYFLRANAYWGSASGRDSLACKDWETAKNLNHNRSWDMIRLHCKK